MRPERIWSADILDGFERTVLSLPDSYDGPVEAVLVRRRLENAAAGVLYLHGFIDYFFQEHLADFYASQGLHFYALDMRRHGRSLRSHQTPNAVRSIDELLTDVAKAVEVIVSEESVEWLLLNGHSTGGLVAALFAQRGQGREHVDALFLNSPFLDMNLPWWQEKIAEPVLAAMGRIAPGLPLPGLSPLYGESLHADQRGSWRYDLRWKPLAGFRPRAGWFGAIHAAQAEVEAGLHIACPVLVLHAERSRWPREWSEEIRSADVVLDVADMRRLAPRLGPEVEAHAVPGGVHDLVLSEPAVVEEVFARVAGWLDRVRAKKPQPAERRDGG